MKRAISCILAAHLSLIASLPAEEVLAVKIATPPGQMKYSLPSFDVRPGQAVKVSLENTDEMPHNIVFTKPADDKGLALAQAAWALGEKGMEKAWVPADPRVLFASKLIGPHETQTLEFTAPNEPGDYPYVCTFPGHAMSMNGVMQVAKHGRTLQELSYALYLGDWSQLPNFAELKPHREGTLPNGLIGWSFDDYKNQFGLVFKGSLELVKSGKYRFSMASDDGAELLIDGKSYITNDGIHPASDLKKRDIQLTEGKHSVEVRYFQGGGQAELYLGWEGPGFSETALSTWVHPRRRKKQKEEEFTGIPLAVEGEKARLYRNFIEGVSPRAIAVGYPGGFNVCFDADQMNLGLFWRGAFMDAKRHWTDRGAGNQPPLGYDVVKPADLLQGVALLEKPEADWPQQKDRAEGIQFLGYSLDSKDYPTFRYTMQGVTFTETYVPPSDTKTPKASFQRAISVTGAVPSGMYLRLASGAVQQKDSGWQVGEKYTLQVGGATAISRSNHGGDLIVPITNDTKLTLTYAWTH
jgi:azurin